MSFHSAKRIREAVKGMGKQVTFNQTLPVELEVSFDRKTGPKQFIQPSCMALNRFVRRTTCIR